MSKLRMMIMGITNDCFWVDAHRLERLSVHVYYLQSVNHDSNLRPYLLGLVVSRVHTERQGIYLFPTKLRIRLSNPLHLPGSYSACTSIEYDHPLSGNTLIASSSMMIHYNLLISPPFPRNVMHSLFPYFEHACIQLRSESTVEVSTVLPCQLTINRR